MRRVQSTTAVVNTNNANNEPRMRDVAVLEAALLTHTFPVACKISAPPVTGIWYLAI